MNKKTKLLLKDAEYLTCPEAELIPDGVRLTALINLVRKLAGAVPTAYLAGLEVERERFKRIMNDHRYKKLEVDSIFQCMLLDIDDDYKDDSQASSAIKEEISKSKV